MWLLLRMVTFYASIRSRVLDIALIVKNHLLFSVCAFPYLLAFTNTTIEIRLVVNGNLVHTLVLPQLYLITSKVSYTM